MSPARRELQFRVGASRRRLAAVVLGVALLVVGCSPVKDTDLGNDIGNVLENVEFGDG